MLPFKYKSFLNLFSASMGATLIRTFLSFALVKFISIFGSIGSLGLLGIVQNTIAIGGAIVTASTQSGVSSRIASGVDTQALKHALQITIFGTLFLCIFLGLTSLLGFPLALPIPWFVFLVASVGLGVNTIICSCIIAHNKLLLLFLVYLTTGLTSFLWIVFSGSYSALNFAIAFALGFWLGAFIGFIALPKVRKIFEIDKTLLPKYWGLIKYGFASIASVVTINLASLIGRNSIMESGIPLNVDLFEVGLRLNSLLEMLIVVPVITILIGLITKEHASPLNRYKLYLRGIYLSVSLLVIAGLILTLFGKFFVALIFSNHLVDVVDYLYLILLIQFLRCLCGVTLLKQLIDGNVFFTIMNDFLYLGAFIAFMRLLPLESGSLNLVFVSLFCSVAVYALLPTYFFFKNK